MTDYPFSRPGIAQTLDPSQITQTEFVTAMVHLHRGELSEATAWRSRIDTTTNWAVVFSITTLSFVFADKSSERHVLIPIVSMFCTFLLLMEARRYRFFDIWRSRARMIEINFYRPMLDGSAPAMKDWAETLACDMEWPHFHMSAWEAAGRRLRRTYQWIFMILLVSWVVVLLTHPSATTSVAEIMARASVGSIPGPLVIAAMLVLYGALAVLGVSSHWASHRAKNLPAGHPGRMRATHLEEA
jgi:uncharacterized membrane protein